MRAIPFEEFVKRARAVHGDDYSYENDTYTTLKKKLWMTHKVCGTRFQQSGSKHLKGQGCPVCAKEYTRTLRKSNYNAFIQKAMGLFGDRYEFPNIKNEYENSHSKITVRCRLCGNTFIKIACDFVTSETGGCWCKEKADEYVTYRLFDRAERVAITNQVFYYYRFSPDSITHKDFSEREFDRVDASQIKVMYMNHHYPDLVKYAERYLVYDCVMSLSKMTEYKASYHQLTRDNIRKYLGCFLMGDYAVGTKLFALVAACSPRLSVNLYSSLKR